MNKRLLKMLLATDVYKTGHRTLYPANTTKIFSNFTPRTGNWSNVETNGVYAHGMRYVINKLRKEWNEFFELKDFEASLLLKEYKRVVEDTIGVKDFDTSHLLELHSLGKLPLEFRAVGEGRFIPYKTPILTIHNTDDKFAWLVNYLETRISNELWPIVTSSTTSKSLKDLLLKYASETGVPAEFVDYQAHDFSYRGMMGMDSAILSGMGHLNYFLGSDTFPAIVEAGKGASVIATEHSVMSAGAEEDEYNTYKRLIKDNPQGILSIVSDTWNIYNVVAKFLPKLKDEILARDGNLVIRPDSGDAIEVLFGGAKLRHPNATKQDHDWAKKGLLNIIEENFGSTTNEKGFKELPIGILWGDGMTPSAIENILLKLKSHGYASSCVVYGVGSYTYQYVTRDTHGFAMKATYATVGDEGRNITKDPITDSGVKKSAKGLLAIINGELVQETTWDVVSSDTNELKKI